MASYSKQMMAVAQAWLAANPDPSDPTLRIPRSPAPPATRDCASTIARAEHALQAYADDREFCSRIADLAGQLREFSAQHTTALRELREAEDDLERAVNDPIAPRLMKYDAGPASTNSVELGRWCLAWARHGHNVLDLSADFVSAMLLTDGRAVDVAEVRAPFGGVLLLIPDGFARGAEGASYTRIHLTELDGGHLSLLANNGTRALDTVIQRDGLTWDALDDLPGNLTEDADQAAARTIRRIVFCALAYVGAVSLSLERRDVGRRRPGPARERAPRVWDVGRTIRLDPHLARAARGGAREVAFRLQCRHIVRGHYRNQPHGPRRSERKRIWIAPFWQGPADGAALVHTYQIVDPSVEPSPVGHPKKDE